MSNPKKIDLAAFLLHDDAPTIPPIRFELGCGNFAQPDDEFCAEHTRDNWGGQCKGGCFMTREEAEASQ